MLTPFVNRAQQDYENDSSEASNGYHKKTAPVGRNERTKNNTASAISPVSKLQHNFEMYEEKSAEWQNFTGFLAALGGCCLTKEKEMNDNLW
ncbi:hypothetical protein G6F68_015009 [Rhizopus microsporus]|nr:hypothetical protein G6F68_015009 [Rhizopus microsporus]